MLIIVTWDDSDGWYDHVMPQIVSQSNDREHDALLGGTGLCGHAQAGCNIDITEIYRIINMTIRFDRWGSIFPAAFL
jgi:phospholipase C